MLAAQHMEISKSQSPLGAPAVLAVPTKVSLQLYSAPKHQLDGLSGERRQKLDASDQFP